MSDTAAPDVSGILALPSATPGAVPAASPAVADAATPPPASATPPPAATGAKDNAGVVFDPAIHETDKSTGLGKLAKATGKWMLKRGNGARAAAGKPMAGAVKSSLVLPPEVIKANIAPPAAPPASGEAPLPTGPVSVTVVSDTPVPQAPPVALADYESTAVGVTHATWAVFQMLGGPKWEPASDEISAWSKAWQRVWHHYQWPIVGPLVELIILAFRAAQKRTDTTKVRGLFAGVWRWAKGGNFSEPAPANDENKAA